jgi:hypothetical protein
LAGEAIVGDLAAFEDVAAFDAYLGLQALELLQGAREVVLLRGRTHEPVQLGGKILQALFHIEDLQCEAR